MEDMSFLALLFVGAIVCFVAFVVGLFHARASGVDDRAAVVIGMTWAAVVAGIGAALAGGGAGIAALAVLWLLAARAMARADPDRARLAALALGVVTVLAVGAL